MNMECKHRIDDRMTKEETKAWKAIRLEIGEMDLILGSPQPLGTVDH